MFYNKAVAKANEKEYPLELAEDTYIRFPLKYYMSVS